MSLDCFDRNGSLRTGGEDSLSKIERVQHDGITEVGMFAMAMAARVGYESAEYKVIESDGSFEVREYRRIHASLTRCVPITCGYSTSISSMTK